MELGERIARQVFAVDAPEAESQVYTGLGDIVGGEAGDWAGIAARICRVEEALERLQEAVKLKRERRRQSLSEVRRGTAVFSRDSVGAGAGFVRRITEGSKPLADSMASKPSCCRLVISHETKQSCNQSSLIILSHGVCMKFLERLHFPWSSIIEICLQDFSQGTAMFD